MPIYGLLRFWDAAWWEQRRELPTRITTFGPAWPIRERRFRPLLPMSRPVVECAQKFGVILAIEPVRSHIVYDSKQALPGFSREIHSPNLQIILDPVNLLSVENCGDYESVFAQAIEDLGEYTAVLHMKDFVVKDHTIVSGAPGTGIMKYDKIMDFVRKEKPYIQMTIEDSTPENAVESRKFLERFEK